MAILRSVYRASSRCQWCPPYGGGDEKRRQGFFAHEVLRFICPPFCRDCRGWPDCWSHAGDDLRFSASADLGGGGSYPSGRGSRHGHPLHIFPRGGAVGCGHRSRLPRQWRVYPNRELFGDRVGDDNRHIFESQRDGTHQHVSGDESGNGFTISRVNPSFARSPA